MSKNSIVLLLLIFLLALVLRFLYFPQNTYFGFDQARDAYMVKEILNGDLKIIGPPTANGVLHHGVLYYYIFAPFYFLSGGDPSVVSSFLRVLNAAGIFILYPLVFVLFGRIAAIFAVFLFAISYEQTQFALFLNHPSLAVISVLFFYLGLAYWIFKKKIWGFYLSLFGLGLSIQFEFVEVQLIAPFILTVLFFRKSLPKINLNNILLALLSFLLPVSSYIIAEAKNDFVITKQIPKIIFGNPSALSSVLDISKFLFIINRHVSDNFSAVPAGSIFIGLIFLVVLMVFFAKNICRRQIIFLALWFFGGLLVYLITSDTAYFYNTGTSVSLLIFAAFILSKLYLQKRLLIIPFLGLILISNLYLITYNNPQGPNEKINPQKGLTLGDEKKVIDFIYQKAAGKEFAVNALTMPYNVNTTWSYLFDWYGKDRYGYVPDWGGDAALGFPGSLPIETARSKLPTLRFLIIEPWEEVIPSYLVESFIKNEEIYTKILEKQQIGTMQVWVQKAR